MRLISDRGTLLFEDPPGDLGHLPGVLWDPRVRAWRAPGHRYAELVAALDLPCEDRVRDPAGPPPRLEPPSLRPYQSAALAAWEGAGRRGVVALPTGSGKTRVAVAAMARARRTSLVLVPTRVLLAQWVGALAAAGLAEVGWYGDGRRELRSVTVSTYASAASRCEELGHRFDLLVVDEAHHFGTGAGDEALELAVAPWRLGLTATPPDEPERLGRLEALVGPVVFRSSIDDLAGLWLAPFELITLELDLSPAERAAYDRELATYQPLVRAFFRTSPQAGWPDFVRESQRSAEGRAALAAWRRSRLITAHMEAKDRVLTELLHRHRHSRVLVFVPDNDAAYRISRQQLIAPITCHIQRKERAEVLARFARGELRALVSAQVLDEGVDVPEADIAIVLGGTRGSRQHVQRIGRVLRPSPGKEALVYELVARSTHELRELSRKRRLLAAQELAELPHPRR